MDNQGVPGDDDPRVDESARLVCRDCGSSRVLALLRRERATDGSPLTERHTCPQCGLRVGLEAEGTGWRPFRLLVSDPEEE